MKPSDIEGQLGVDAANNRAQMVRAMRKSNVRSADVALLANCRAEYVYKCTTLGDPTGVVLNHLADLTSMTSAERYDMLHINARLLMYRGSAVSLQLTNEADINAVVDFQMRLPTEGRTIRARSE